MKFIVSVLLIALVSFVACLYLPWWSIAPAAFLVVVCLPQKPLYAFLAGFIAVFLLWALIALVISNQNQNILAGKISFMILKSNSPVLLILLTAFLGAIVSGTAALAASYLRKPAGPVTTDNRQEGFNVS